MCRFGLDASVRMPLYVNLEDASLDTQRRDTLKRCIGESSAIAR